MPAPIDTLIRGSRNASPLHHSAFGTLSTFGTTIGISRTINFVRETGTEPAATRSITRRLWALPQRNQTGSITSSPA